MIDCLNLDYILLSFTFLKTKLCRGNIVRNFKTLFTILISIIKVLNISKLF